MSECDESDPSPHDEFIDAVCDVAYPDGSPEGREHERSAVRAMLDDMESAEFVDVIRKAVYPFGSLEGPLLERAIIGSFMEAIAFVNFRFGHRGADGVQECRDEARRVFEACMKASGL